MSRYEKYKVLVIDDDKDILDLLQYNLEQEGFMVKTLADSRKAITMASEFLPDLILLDIMMPHHDGIEICQRLRETSSLQEVPVLFLTARMEEYSEVAAFDVGADDYIVKPIRPRALMKTPPGTTNRAYRSRGTGDRSSQLYRAPARETGQTGPERIRTVVFFSG